MSRKTVSLYMHFFTTLIIGTVEIQIKLPEIPLNMSVCEGSDNEHLEVKQEPMDSDKVKLEESPPGLEPADRPPDPQDVLAEAQFQAVTGSGKLCMVEQRTQYLDTNNSACWICGLSL